MVRDAVIAVVLPGAESTVNSEYDLNVGSSSRSIFNSLVRSVLQRVSHSAQKFSDLLSDHHHHFILRRIVKKEG